jgi:DNA-damage-inducible protein J
VQAGDDAVATNALVQTRIDQAIKDEAAAVLKEMGLTVSDAVRLMLVRVAREKALPFDVRTPNAATREAIAELQGGKGARFDCVESLMADLRADD